MHRPRGALLVVALAGAAIGLAPASAPAAVETVQTRGAWRSTPTPPSSFAPGRHRVTFDVNGTTRTAIVEVPTDGTSASPLVFAFHGHGSTGAELERRLDLERWWPDAIVVYPDGLVGHARRADAAGGETGWQTRPGEAGDRDLAFYDAMLTAARASLRVDDERIYVLGHSNGSVFASVVMAARGAELAAIANLSTLPSRAVLEAAPTRSMFVSLGTEDPVVSYDRQKRTVDLARQKIGADPARATVRGRLRSERGADGLELALYVYPGGHTPPPEVARLAVEFFRRHTRTGG